MQVLTVSGVCCLAKYPKKNFGYTKNCFIFELINYMNMKINENLIGKRIRLISMENDPNPVEKGSMGTIYHVGHGVINVRWDSGRTLGVVEGEDLFEIVETPDTYLPPNNFLVFSGNI